jgi:hypothetical protein
MTTCTERGGGSKIDLAPGDRGRLAIARGTFPLASDGVKWTSRGERTLLAPASLRYPVAVSDALQDLGPTRTQKTPLPCFFAPVLRLRLGRMFSCSNSSGGNEPRIRVGNFRCSVCTVPSRCLKVQCYPEHIDHKRGRVIAWPDSQFTPLRGCCGHEAPGGFQRLTRRLSFCDTRTTSPRIT